ncbi:peroxiredoxin [Kamptonema animale CS-326]|jgi:peroxiredoxin|uniref:peroxiredoxin n=1 Tax=Kamptonema animale TaxID=92934 RepID=UPI00232D674E|nr:peroxiredoxin [Kamptonema animale]MDB9511923.1 peroxiredoxin [Kamptonema animale CS-326]
MAKPDNLYELPQNLPVPVDDGATNHLLGLQVPAISLMSTAGIFVDLASLAGRSVVYCYPLTGRPDLDNIPQGWNQIAGARGCTPQSCAFRDRYQELKTLGVKCFGLSGQSTEYQQEAVKRLHLPFELLSDLELAFTKSLKLPTFELDSRTFIKRLTLILSSGRIEKVFYPVFPPDRNAEEVIDWLSHNPQKNDA